MRGGWNAFLNCEPTLSNFGGVTEQRMHVDALLGTVDWVIVEEELAIHLRKYVVGGFGRILSATTNEVVLGNADRSVDEQVTRSSGRRRDVELTVR